MRTEALLMGLCLAALAAPAAEAHGQSAADTATVYEREVFNYARSGRPDPFRSLLNSAELGLRFEELVLVGVMYDPVASRSVAVLGQKDGARRIRARVGERVGSVRIVAIRPQGVDVVVEELGVARRASLELKTAAKKGG